MHCEISRFPVGPVALVEGDIIRVVPLQCVGDLLSVAAIISRAAPARRALGCARGRLHDPGQHQLIERLVPDRVEPNRVYASERTCQSITLGFEAITACARPAPCQRSGPARLGPGYILWQAATRAASSALVCADPRCSSALSRPPGRSAICTVVAPEAVRPFRTNNSEPTGPIIVSTRTSVPLCPAQTLGASSASDESGTSRV